VRLPRRNENAVAGSYSGLILTHLDTSLATQDIIALFCLWMVMQSTCLTSWNPNKRDAVPLVPHQDSSIQRHITSGLVTRAP
jgi:hypothetical protein